MQSSKEWVEIAPKARKASKALPIREPETFHDRARRCSDRAFERSSTNGGMQMSNNLDEKEREAGLKWLEFLEFNFIDDHLSEVFKY